MLLVTVLAGPNFKFYPGLYIWKFSLDSNMYNIVLFFLNHVLFILLSQLTEFLSCRDRHSSSTEWFLPPQSLEVPILFTRLFSIVFHISGIPQYLTFCEQFILVIFMLLRSFNTMTYGQVSFLCKAVMLSHCLYRPISFACLSVSGMWVAHTSWVWGIILLWTGVSVKCFFFRWAPLLCLEFGCF